MVGRTAMNNIVYVCVCDCQFKSVVFLTVLSPQSLMMSMKEKWTKRKENRKNNGMIWTSEVKNNLKSDRNHLEKD